MTDPTIDMLVQLAQDLGLDGGELFDLVHDVASLEPSRINTEGLTAQITFLTAALGAAGTEQAIRGVATAAS